MRLFVIILNSIAMESNVRQRIKSILMDKSVTINALAKGNGSLQRKLQRQLNEDATITFDIIEYLQDEFPEVSAEWLLRGKEPMYLADGSAEALDETRPRIPYEAAAGTLTVGMDGVMPYDCEQMPVVKAFPHYDFTILVRGESMAPEYQSGDEVACLYVRNSSYTQWGRVHVLDTTQGVVIKRIYDNGETVLCKSDNPRYGDFSIPKSEVFNVALVIGLIRRY